MSINLNRSQGSRYNDSGFSIHLDSVWLNHEVVFLSSQKIQSTGSVPSDPGASFRLGISALSIKSARQEG